MWILKSGFHRSREWNRGFQNLGKRQMDRGWLISIGMKLYRRSNFITNTAG
jgi:hypothetical protein